MLANILNHLKFLIQQDTQNPPRRITKEDIMYQQLSSFFADLGFQVEVTDLGDGHVIFYAIKGQPTVLFNVHIDTVPVTQGWQHDPFDLTVVGDKAYGRGSCDIKGAAACLMTIAEQKPENMAVLFTSDEEGASGCCVQNFIDTTDLSQFKQIIVAEPTNTQAVLSHRGYLSVYVDHTGDCGHSSMASALHSNAVHKASNWLSKALSFAQSQVTDDNPAGICFNLGTIKGGSKNNMIAESCSLSFSARVPPGHSTEETYHQLKSLDESVDSHWDARMMAPSLPSSEDSKSLAQAFCKQHNIPLTDPVDFWTEASLFSQAGIPSIVLGPGNIEQAHKVDEYVHLNQLELACKTYLEVIQNEN